MILVDTSVWIDHFRNANAELTQHLARGRVLAHPFVVAELALGSLRDRSTTLALLDLLPQARMARTNEVRHVIESHRLYNLGIGLTDAHLISSILLDSDTQLSTNDKRLIKAAAFVGIQVVSL